MQAIPLKLALLGLCAVLTGCNSAPSTQWLQVSRSKASAPPGAPPGTCWSKTVRPAIYETVTEQIMLQPAQVQNDGTVLSPAIYKTETHQAVVRERKETWFETPCPMEMTPDFLASLQRALKARNLYRGAISGEMDLRTRTAVHRYQKSEGLDSADLSLAAARKLGLITVYHPRGDVPAGG